jgi:hypothetical protein
MRGAAVAVVVGEKGKGAQARGREEGTGSGERGGKKGIGGGSEEPRRDDESLFTANDGQS